MRDSVPSGSYSSVCNVLRQWNIPLIPTYRYRLYDIYIYIEREREREKVTVDSLRRLTSYAIILIIIISYVIVSSKHKCDE